MPLKSLHLRSNLHHHRIDKYHSIFFFVFSLVSLPLTFRCRDIDGHRHWHIMDVVARRLVFGVWGRGGSGHRGGRWLGGGLGGGRGRRVLRVVVVVVALLGVRAVRVVVVGALPFALAAAPAPAGGAPYVHVAEVGGAEAPQHLAEENAVVRSVCW